MTILKTLLTLGAMASLAACAIPDNKTVDRSLNSHHVSTLVAGIWVDPNGCDHWLIDDGVEGYLSERMTPDGLPVCSGVAPPTSVVGPFQSGSPVPDPL